MSSDKIIVKGKPVDDETRCVHYHSPVDIIAIKLKCCNEYYPCYYCHQDEANHLPQVWGKEEFETKAILCGYCKTELTIKQYLYADNQCSYCKAKFNPLCINHHDFYFEK